MRIRTTCLNDDAPCFKVVSSIARDVLLGRPQSPRHLARWFGVITLIVVLLLVGGCAQAPTAPVIERRTASIGPESGSAVETKVSPVLSDSAVQQQLQKFSKAWEGVRYRLGGTDESGIDCSALSVRVYRDLFGTTIPRTTSGQLETGRRVEPDQLAPGDLVFFKLPGGDRHVGVFVGSGQFLHASESRGVMTSSLSSPFWRQHFLLATRPETTLSNPN